MSIKSYIIFASCACLLGLTAETRAQDTSATSREEALLQRIEQLEQRVVDLEKRLTGQTPPAPPQPSTATAAAPTTAPASDLEQRVVKLEESATTQKKPSGTELQAIWKDGLRFESADQKLKLRVGGRILADWAFFHQTDEYETALGNALDRFGNRVGDEQDGAEFRWASLDVRGEIYDNVIYRAEYDFTGDNGHTGFKDVYVGLKGLPYVGTLQIGHFKEPFSLEQMEGFSYLTFMERSLADAFAPQRNMGFQLQNTLLEQRMTWALGAFKEVDGFPSDDDSDEDEGFSFTGRVTGLPWYAEDGRRLVHLGASYSHRNPDGAVIGWSSRPESRLGNRYVNTERFAGYSFGVINNIQGAYADDVDLYNLESALVYGPFSLQAEYMLANAETLFAGKPSLDGFYVFASYFLTGENRSYELANGTFGRVKPKKNFKLGEDGGWGAWELGLRFSSIDLTDGMIRGGEQDDITFGVNWYLNPTTRFMLNYIHANIEHDLYDDDVDILEGRFQVDF